VSLSTSVIIPTYNRSELVCRAVESALRTIVPGDEIIIVDDGSTDGTLTRLEPLRDRVRIIVAPHRGAGATRNRGIAEAEGDLVAFLDSDDEWADDHLTLHRAVHASRPDIAFSFSDFSMRDSEGTVHQYISRWHNDPRPWSQILSPGITIGDVIVHIGDISLAELKSDYISTITTVAKRNALADSRWFAEDVPTYEDWQCFGRLAIAGPAAYLDRETATNHGHDGMRLTDVSVLEKVQARLKISQRVWGGNEAFLAKHADEYREHLRNQHTLLTKCLLVAGRTQEARTAIRNAGALSLPYHVLSWLPGPIARLVVTTRAILKG
jgi:glycosyltransferase involved in cell wall biosynthesis